MSRPPSVSSLAGAPVPASSDTGKSPYVERAETFQRLELAQKRKSMSENELEALVRIRSSTPNMSPIELNETDQTIVGLRQQIGHMNYQIQQLMAKLESQQTLIAQQKTTIKNQSKIIENPRGDVNPQYVASTPRHHAAADGQAAFENPRAHGPPPPYNNSPYRGNARDDDGGQAWPAQYEMTAPTVPNPSVAPNVFTHGFVATNPVTYHQQQSHRGADEFGSPRRHVHSTSFDHRSGLSRSSTALTTLQSTSSGEHDPFGPIARPTGRFNARAPTFQPPHRPAPPPQPELVAAPLVESPLSNPYPETSSQVDQSALTLADTLGPRDAILAEQFDQVFAASKAWALNHCNYPNTAGDHALSQDLKHSIIRAASAQTAFPLMRHSTTRYWLITKLLILYLVKHVLRHNTFAGLDKDSDSCIDGLRSTIYDSTPSQVRCVILKKIAEKTQQIVSNSKYKSYVEHLTKQRAEKMYWHVRSLKHKSTLRDQEDMILLVAEAHKLAEMMNVSAYEYALNWADIGDRFDRFSMKNICPRYGACTDDEMRSRWATVRLCATPEVVIRKNRAESGHVEEIKLHRMRVLLKVRDD